MDRTPPVGEEVLSDDEEKAGEENPVWSRAGGNKIVAVGNEICVSENKIVSGNPSFSETMILFPAIAILTPPARIIKL